MKPYGVTRVQARTDRPAVTFRKASRRRADRLVDNHRARAAGRRDLIKALEA